MDENPKWPYEKWNQIEETKPIPHEIDRNDTPKSDSALLQLLKQLTPQTEVLGDEKNAAVYKEVQELMGRVLYGLKKEKPIFKFCRLIQAGSFAEGTKVGKADEFDYLLVLDFLNDSKVFNPVIDESSFQIIIKDKEAPIINDLLNQYPDIVQFDDRKAFINSGFRWLLLRTFMEVFDAELKKGWKRLNSDINGYCSSKAAATIHLNSETYNMDIDIDLCLCFQLKPEDLLQAAQENKEKLFFPFLLRLHQKSSFDVFALVGQIMECSPLTRTKISAAFREFSDLSHYGCYDGRVMTYKFAKCLVSNFIPKYSSDLECTKCCHSLIRSYALKTVILFMIRRYPDDKYWASDAICTRVVEVFSILKHCITDKQDLYANIALCCLPGRQKLDYIPTINPARSDTELLYEIRSCPKYQNELELDNEEANDRIKSWFCHISQDHLTSYDLIVEFESFLKDLGRRSVNN